MCHTAPIPTRIVHILYHSIHGVHRRVGRVVDRALKKQSCQRLHPDQALFRSYLSSSQAIVQSSLHCRELYFQSRTNSTRVRTSPTVDLETHTWYPLLQHPSIGYNISLPRRHPLIRCPHWSSFSKPLLHPSTSSAVASLQSSHTPS